ncbi:MAG: TonB-dependent hemoglobin/transferrin/lactoferrin family receptor [Blastomonas sp.]
MIGTALALCPNTPALALENGAAEDGAIGDAALDDGTLDEADADAPRDTITVTGTRTAVAVEDAPVSVTVIEASDIADQLATDIKDLVRYEPGVTVRRAPARFGAALGSTGRAGNEGFTVRGIGGNRVIIQVDGIRVPDGFSFGAQDSGRGGYVDIGLVKRVEILRGPGSALYGSDGLSGVVSFVTSDPADFIGKQGDSVGGLLRAGYSSSDQEFSETAIFAGRSGAVSAMLAYTRRDYQELDNRGTDFSTGSTRTAPNPMDGRSDAVLGKLVWDAGGGHRLRLTGEYLDSLVKTNVLSGLGNSGFGTIVDNLTARDTSKRKRVTLDWSWLPSGDGSFVDDAMLALYWQDGKDIQFTDEDRTPSADRERLNTFENRVIGAGAELHSSFATGPLGHRLAYGGDVSLTRQRGLRDGVVPPTGEVFPTRAFPETDFTRGGLFIGDEISIGDGRLTLYPALRFDFYDLDPSDDPLLPTFQGAGQSGSRLTPKIAAVAKIGSGFSLYGNYAEGFKAPEPGQVNQFFENLAFGYTSAPNPDLRPETSQSWEAGLRYSGKTLFAGVTYFHGRYKDFISQEVVGGGFTPSDPAIFQFINITRARIRGWEARARLRTEAGFTADLALAVADGDTIDPGGIRSPLSSIDPFTLVAGFGYRDPGERFGFQFSGTFNDRKRLNDTVGVCTGDCFRPGASLVLDLTAFVRIAKGVTLRGGVFNISNEKYALWSDVRGLAASSSVTDAYTRPGRNASASISLSF